MRISTNLLFHTGLKTIGTQQADLMHLYQQIGSGQRMVTAADDPLAASQSINIAQSQSLNQRFAENRAVAMRNLSIEEDALTSLTTLLQDVRTRLVEVGGAALSDADRGTMAEVLRGARESMLAIANTTDGNGQYVFSGSQGQNPAYRLDSGGQYRYIGDTLQREIQADQTRRIAGSDIGSDIFQRAQPGTLAYTTRQDAVGAGSTAVLGAPTVADRSQGNADSRFGFEVTFISATSYTVRSTDFSTTPPTVEPVPDPADPANIKSLPEGATVLDLGKGTQAQISGAPAAGDVFTVTPMQHDEDFNLFNILNDVIDKLETPVAADPSAQATLRNTINTAMQQLASGYDNVLTVRSSIGARMNELSAMDDVGTQRNLGFTKDLSRLEDLDYYDATMKLNLRKMALEGASLAFQTIQNLSLFNMGGK